MLTAAESVKLTSICCRVEFRSLYLAQMAELHRKVAYGEVQQGTADDAGAPTCVCSIVLPRAKSSNHAQLWRSTLFAVRSHARVCFAYTVRFLSLGFALHACLDKVGAADEAAMC